MIEEEYAGRGRGMSDEFVGMVWMTEPPDLMALTDGVAEGAFAPSLPPALRELEEKMKRGSRVRFESGAMEGDDCLLFLVELDDAGHWAILITPL